MKLRRTVLLSLALFTCAPCAVTEAHFPWLVRGEDGKVAYFFGEDPTDRTYKLPPTIAAAKVQRVVAQGKREPVALKAIERDDLVGMVSESEVPSDVVLVSATTYGIHGGSRLEYYTVHQGGKLPSSRDAYQTLGSGHDLSAELIDTDAGVDVYVSWKGKPAAAVDVYLYCDEGHEEGHATTGDDGKVSFTDKQVEPGLNGIRLGTSVKESGTLNNQTYDSAKHYLTVTFFDPESSHPKKATEAVSAKLPALPVGLTSFGAVRAGESIYVFGGHTGGAHSYSNVSQSNELLRLDLSAPEKKWQAIAEGDRLQGLGMVAYKDQLILLGGFNARNAEGEPHDLFSQADVNVYDLPTGRWSQLPPLPEPRSSHDAALIDSTIYVVGGWKLSGGSETQWHTTAWSMDLAAKDPQWVELPSPPFQRRALAAVAHKGKLFALGGMNKEGGPTKAVSIYDPQTKTWTEAAELLGEKPMAGFGAAGWSLDGQLVVTTYEGSTQRWNDDRKNWTMLGRTQDARFFHRLLPLSAKQLVSIGGANMDSGKFREPEVVSVP